jgi:hypothetical protein
MLTTNIYVEGHYVNEKKMKTWCFLQIWDIHVKKINLRFKPSVFATLGASNSIECEGSKFMDGVTT